MLLTMLQFDSGVYIVSRSQSSTAYVVQFASVADADIPLCECEDWHRHNTACLASTC